MESDALIAKLITVTRWRTDRDSRARLGGV